MPSVNYSLIPEDYARQVDAIAPGASALVDSRVETNEPWYEALLRVIPGIVTGYQQKQLLDVQVDRARAGLPPLDMSQYAPGVNVGLADSSQKALIIGGAFALVLALILTRRR